MNYEAGQLEQARGVLPDPIDRNARRRRLVILAAVLVLLAGVLVYWKSRGGEGGQPAKAAGAEQAPSVTVVVPGRQFVDRQVSANGTLGARREMPVGVAGEGGRVTRVLVEAGQWVAAGQVLATVDRSVQSETATSLSAQIRVAQADAKLAQAQLERAQQLVGRGFISKADIDTRTATRDAANARVRVAQAQLAQQQALNGRLDIRAPAAGLVLTRGVEPGQIVSSGSGTLFRMAMGGQMELRAALAESDLATIRPGARAQVTPVGSAHAFSGQVWQVSPVIDPQTRQGVARVALSFDPELRPGGFATAVIVGGAAEVPLLPESAVQSDRTGNYVYVVDAGNHAQRRAVTVGDVTDRGVSIVKGLSGTERVVASAGAFLSPGQLIKPVLRAEGK